MYKSYRYVCILLSMHFQHFIGSSLIQFLNKNMGARINKIFRGGLDSRIGIDFFPHARICPNSEKVVICWSKVGGVWLVLNVF